LYPEAVHTPAEPVPYLSPTENEAIFVDTKEGVEEMLAELREASEIAIDLEHHDTHSYVGIVCLMQISTRQKDWIIDTLVPWREDLEVLNEVFADPKILKVLQGSTMDMIWLQRDLGLYVVGLFDTFHASTALGFPQKSLKYLLERFCDVHAKKKYQMADWRIRPLPQEMLDYARSDTHYLLFIYDNLRNMLLEASTPDNIFINYVLEESRKEALQRYERAQYDVERGLGSVGWFAPLARRSARFTPEQFGVYRAVHEWRDTTARASDEGPMFIMSQATLFAVAEAMPTTVAGLISVTNPVSKAIKEGSRELVEIIKKGKDTGREGPTVIDVMRENEAFLPRRRYTRRPAEREQPNHGVGATLQLLNENGDVGGSADRTFTSRFWGAVTKPLISTATRFGAPLNDALRLILPLPTMDARSFTTTAQTSPAQQAAEAPTQLFLPLNGSAEEGSSSNAFILKELDRSTKRKVDSTELEGDSTFSLPRDGMDKNADFSPLGHPMVEATATRADAKARRKEEKRQKKALRQADTDVPVQFFDYTKGDSVLHATPDKHQPDGVAAVPRQFNPYAKALDGPQGLKRVRKESAGKSFTFKK
jgi:exosome complex exonuclease RRP6